MRQNQDIHSSPDIWLASVSEFHVVVSQMISKLWRLKKERIWTYAISPSPGLALAQGWKIHISAIPKDAIKILKIVAEICIKWETEFKFNTDYSVLKNFLSKACPRGSSGKFITIYPKDKIVFLSMLEDLYCSLKNEKGPYILSDRRYKDSKTVYYRYGGVYPFESRELNGDRLYNILDNDFKFILDERVPYFKLPEWVEDIQENDNNDNDNDDFCNNKYQIISVIRFSNTGGVYKGLNKHDQSDVLIKEARPFIEITASGVDAVYRLRKEFRILNKLVGSQIAPVPYDFFEEWEHVYIAQEFIPGIDLKKYNAQYNKLIKRNTPNEEIRLWFEKIVIISKNIMSKLIKLHSHNIIFGDLSPGNIIIDPETLDIKFVDFEGSCEPGVDSHDNVLTPGFASKERDARTYIRFPDDLYALGCVMAFLLMPITQLSDLDPDKIKEFVEEIKNDIGLPTIFVEVILGLISDEPRDLAHYYSMLETKGSMHLMKPRRKNRCTISKRDLNATITKITNNILFNVSSEGTHKIAEAGWRDSLAVADGALGIAFALYKINNCIPASLDRWILRNLKFYDLLPGLYNGLSGIAWVLMELGYTQDAEMAIHNAKMHRLLYQDMNLGVGASGYGMTNLFFWKKTNNEYYLKEAIKIADILIETKQEVGDTYCWGDYNSGNGLDIGFYGGSTGVSLFLLYIYCATKDPQYLEIGERGLAFDLNQGRAEEVDGPLGFPASSKNSTILYPYLNYGSAGIGTVLLRYYFITRNQGYIQFLEQIKTATFQKYAVFPGLFTGLAGLGNYLLDAAVFLGDDSYIGRAKETAEGLCLFSISTNKGISFPGDGLRSLCIDYSTGASGAALFLHRLNTSGPNFNFTMDELLFSHNTSQQ